VRRLSVSAAAVIPLKWRIVNGYDFKHDAHINILEAQALFSYVVHRIRGGLRSSRLVVVIDSSVLKGSVRKGRSSSRALNFFLRRIAGWSLSAGVTVDVLWVPTWANPSDAPTRRYSIQEWVGKAGHAEACNRRGLADDADAIRLIDGFDSMLAAPVPPIPLERHLVRRSCQHSLRRCGRRFVWSVFDGGGNLSKALSRIGFRVAAFDFLDKDGQYRATHDLALEETVLHLLRCLRYGIIFYVHFAIDCRTWSIIRARFACGTRSQRQPWGDGSREDEVLANKVLRNVLRLIAVCRVFNVFWTIENPKSSRLFFAPPIQRCLTEPDVHRTDFHMCAFGLKDPVSAKFYFKPTSIIGTLPELQSLNKLCPHNHEHETVEGTVLYNGRVIKRSKVAGAYPIRFCSHLAALVGAAHTWAHNARSARRSALSLSPA
jgi:hypothetical protein